MLDYVKIRPLERGELDQLIDAQNLIFSDYVIPLKSTREFFLDFLRSVGGKLENVLIAVEDGAIIGYVNPVIDGREAWIGGVGVVPDKRRRGLGERLMLKAEEFSKRRGADMLFLEVIQGNNRAYEMYRKLGYADNKTYLTAEGRPLHFAGFELRPEKATMSDLLFLHEKAYADSCWQRRKKDSIVHSARSAECYKVDGGFVLVRRVDTSGFVPFLGVLPEKRGKGVGTSLAKFALNRLYELGAFKVTVYNVNDDLATTRLLDKFDFAVTLKQVEMVKKL
jgi:ribosomal protein S18 acetylase RimI-like enzyme